MHLHLRTSFLPMRITNRVRKALAPYSYIMHVIPGTRKSRKCYTEQIRTMDDTLAKAGSGPLRMMSAKAAKRPEEGRAAINASSAP